MSMTLEDLRARIGPLKWAIDLVRDAGGLEEAEVLDDILMDHKRAIQKALVLAEPDFTTGDVLHLNVRAAINPDGWKDVYGSKGK